MQPKISNRKDKAREALNKIQAMAAFIVKDTKRGIGPSYKVPQRVLSNTEYDEEKGILMLGDQTQTRNLYDAGQVRKFMQTTLVASSVKELIDEGKTTTLRGLFYKNLHTIAGHNEKTFDDQAESDEALEDLEVILEVLREDLNTFAKKAGTMVGPLVLEDVGDTIDLSHMGSGGYAIPSIVEPDKLVFKKCSAKFVLHVEKNTVWQRFNEDRFWQKHNCILTEGGGQPPRGVRRLLRRLNEELKLPVYCLLDNDPWGYYIYSVIKTGSISLAHESPRMAVPTAKYLGLRTIDFDRCNMSDDVRIRIGARDISRAKQIANYPWFRNKLPWQTEIAQLVGCGYKMEVESLISKGISYVTEEYVPERLKLKDWLD